MLKFKFGFTEVIKSHHHYLIITSQILKFFYDFFNGIDVPRSHFLFEIFFT